MFLTAYWRPTVQNACLEQLWLWNIFEVFFSLFKLTCSPEQERAGRVETTVLRVLRILQYWPAIGSSGKHEGL